jgi:transcriptional regulator with XRE-family HTH domain
MVFEWPDGGRWKVSEQTTDLGASVRRLRGERGMTQMALAVATGAGVSQIAQIEQGVIKDPRLSTMKALADALEVSLDDLVGRTSPVDLGPRGDGVSWKKVAGWSKELLPNLRDLVKECRKSPVAISLSEILALANQIERVVELAPAQGEAEQGKARKGKK